MLVHSASNLTFTSFFSWTRENVKHWLTSTTCTLIVMIPRTCFGVVRLHADEGILQFSKENFTTAWLTFVVLFFAISHNNIINQTLGKRLIIWCKQLIISSLIPLHLKIFTSFICVCGEHMLYQVFFANCQCWLAAGQLFHHRAHFEAWTSPMTERCCLWLLFLASCSCQQFAEGQFQLTFSFTFPQSGCDVVHFAFTYPHSYQSSQRQLASLQQRFQSCSTANPDVRLSSSKKKLLNFSPPGFF